MYCQFCGESVADNAIFCMHCGQKLLDVSVKSEKKLVSKFNISQKYKIVLMWWTLIILIIGVIVYLDTEDFVDTLLLFPVYFGGILLAYTIRYCKRKKESTGADNKTVTKSKSDDDDDEYTLMQFAEKYGDLQICKFQDNNGVMRSKCVFVRRKEVYFSTEIGELNATEIVKHKSSLVIKKSQYSGDYIMTSH